MILKKNKCWTTIVIIASNLVSCAGAMEQSRFIPSLCTMIMRPHVETIVEQCATNEELLSHLYDQESSCPQDCPLLCARGGLGEIVRYASLFLHAREGRTDKAYWGAIIHSDEAMQSLFFSSRAKQRTIALANLFQESLEDQEELEVLAANSNFLPSFKGIIDQVVGELKTDYMEILALAYRLNAKERPQENNSLLDTLPKSYKQRAAELAILLAACNKNKDLAYVAANLCTCMPSACLGQELFMPPDPQKRRLLQSLIDKFNEFSDVIDGRIENGFKSLLALIPKRLQGELGVWALNVAVDSHWLADHEVGEIYLSWRNLFGKIAVNDPLQATFAEATNRCINRTFAFGTEVECLERLVSYLNITTDKFPPDKTLVRLLSATALLPYGYGTVSKKDKDKLLGNFSPELAKKCYGIIWGSTKSHIEELKITVDYADYLTQLEVMKRVPGSAALSIKHARGACLWWLCNKINCLYDKNSFYYNREAFKPVSCALSEVFPPNSKIVPVVVANLLIHPWADEEVRARYAYTPNLLAYCVRNYLRKTGNPGQSVLEDVSTHKYVKQIVERLECAANSYNAQEKLCACAFDNYYIDTSISFCIDMLPEQIIRGLVAGHFWWDVQKLIRPSIYLIPDRSLFLKEISTANLYRIKMAAGNLEAYAQSHNIAAQHYLLMAARQMVQYVDSELKWRSTLGFLAFGNTKK